jgi:hypothetical protein
MLERYEIRERVSSGTALAALSWLFFHATRLLLHVPQRAAMLVLSRQPLKWCPLGPEVLRRPLALPVVMTSGPRWNPHAVIATAGPVLVERVLTIDRKPADASAKLWTVVVHNFPDFYPVASTGSSSPLSEIRLRPGRYVLALRYYEYGNEIELPAVTVDGGRVIPSRKLAADPNSFYRDLHLRGGFFYRCLHYYVFEMLRLRDRLSDSFVRREYLPARNPETQFQFGFLRRGDHVDLAVVRPLLPAHVVYLTIYNRASFPVYWCKVTETDLASPPAAADGFYLIRSHTTHDTRAAAGTGA